MTEANARPHHTELQARMTSNREPVVRFPPVAQPSGFLASLAQLVLGRPLANREDRARKINAIEGVGAMGLDALASSAYGPEAALTILVPVGALGLAKIGWVMTPIVVLLVLALRLLPADHPAYPGGGGSYTVAKENLGTTPALIAAVALCRTTS